MCRIITIAYLAVTLVACLGGASARSSSLAYRVTQIGHIDAPGGTWDYASFDPVRHRVYIAHGNDVLMIDATTEKAYPHFAAGDRVHAIVPVPGTGVLVTTNSGDSSAKVIAASSGKLLASLRTAADPDGAVFDPSTGLVVVVNGDAGKVSLVDPKTRNIAGSINIGGQLEFPAVNGRGALYVNVFNRNNVAVVDLAARKVRARYSLPGCIVPTGLAYVSHERLISVCFNGVAEILAARTGRRIARLKIGGFPDSVIYDPDHELAYVPSAGNGTLAVIALSGRNDDSIVDTVPTQVGTRTGAFDPGSARIWLPAAKFRRYSLKRILAGRPPKMEAGTFKILVLSVSG